jgi:hypothetical protein
MIRRRFSRGQREGGDGGVSTEEAPLFNLDEIYEQRILSWSPEPEDELAADEVDLSEEMLVPVPEPVDPDPQPEYIVPERDPAAPAVSAAAAAPAAPTPATEEQPTAGRQEPPRVVPASDEPRRRGRPRGRPRRQVHFHVDPDEERLLMQAVETYGSQQKALVAALAALTETERLRSRIDELERESERQRALLAKAESLFARD